MPAKRKVGRPPNEEKYLVIAGRVPERVHRMVKESAERSGRSMSEEISWQLQRAFEWERTEGDIRQMLAKHQAAMREDLRSTLQDQGYQPIHDINGTVWAEPGMEIGNFRGPMNPAIEEAIERVVLRAIKKSRED